MIKMEHLAPSNDYRVTITSLKLIESGMPVLRDRSLKHAPTEDSCEPIRQPLNSLFSETNESVSWDDDNTMVEFQGLGSQLEPDQQCQTPKMNKKLKAEKDEVFACIIAGCSKGCISQAELYNHVEVMHSSEKSEPLPSTDSGLVELAGLTTQHHDFAGEITGEGEDTVKLPLTIEGDQTIRPTPITEESLRALDESTTTELTRSIDGLSISDDQRSHEDTMSVVTTYSVVDGMEEVLKSDIAEQDSPRIQIPVRILLCLWMKLIMDMARRFTSSGTRQHAGYPEQNGQYVSASQSKESLGNSSIASSQTSGTRSFKRRRPSDDGEEEGDRKNAKPRLKSGDFNLENKPLACPFNKYNHHTFGGDSTNSNYHVCGTWHDVKTAYFKQHLLRNHCIPEYHCDRCGGDFKNTSQLRDHRRMDPPCQLTDLDNQKIMPEVQAELGLRTRNVVGMDRVTYWYKVYDTIFGSEARKARPVEPYYEGPSHEILKRFLHFSERRMPDVIRRSRELLHTGADEYHEQDTQLVQTILQEASDAFMAELKHSHQPSLREIKQQNSPQTSAIDTGDSTVVLKDVKRQTTQAVPSENSRKQDSKQVILPAAASPTHTPRRTMHLPTRLAEQPMIAPSDVPSVPQPYGFPHGPEYVDASWGQDFEQFSYLNMPEFQATIDDSDLYGPGTIMQHDIEADYVFFDAPNNSSRRERRLP